MFSHFIKGKLQLEDMDVEGRKLQRLPLPASKCLYF
jgi:hypothetical protein